MLPIKTMQFNKCPAVAPLGVLDAPSQTRLQIDIEQIHANAHMLASLPEFTAKVSQACEIIDKQFQSSLFTDERAVDGQLYDGFFEYHDKQVMRMVRAAEPAELSPEIINEFEDNRLQALLPLYKARNFPRALTGEERQAWDEFCKKQLMHGGAKSRMAVFLQRLQEVASRGNLTNHQEYLLHELKLYAESVMPEPEY